MIKSRKDLVEVLCSEGVVDSSFVTSYSGPLCERVIPDRNKLISRVIIYLIWASFAAPGMTFYASIYAKHTSLHAP